MEPFNSIPHVITGWVEKLYKIPFWTGLAWEVGPTGIKVRLYVSNLSIEAAIQAIVPEADVKKMSEFHFAPLARAAAAATPGLRPGSNVVCNSHNRTTELPQAGVFGTLSAFIQNGATTWLLAPNHVMANNGLLTFFPGETDGVFAGQPLTSVSRTIKFQQITQDGPNPVDAALAQLEDGVSPDRPFFPPTWNVLSGEPVRPAKNTKVHLRNRSGDPVTGTVIEPHISVRMKGDLGGGVNGPIMTDHIVVSLDSGEVHEGDSGSLVVADVEGGQAPVGFHIGLPNDQSEKNILITPLEAVFTTFAQQVGETKAIMI